VVAIGHRLQGFPELSKGLHEQNSTNPFKNCNDLLSFCAFYPVRPSVLRDWGAREAAVTIA
jgi:hypothetical protein